MKLFVVLLATAVALANGAAGGEVYNVYQFGKFILCLVDVGLLSGYEYSGYGCYCGYGGKGQALDPTDRCCLQHDNCYGRAVTEAGCSSFQTYATIYDYEKTTDHSGNCAIECKKESDYPLKTAAKCKAFLCECDRVGAQCFADVRCSFNRKYVSYDKDSC